MIEKMFKITDGLANV